jgi:hypothetical protein
MKQNKATIEVQGDDEIAKVIPKGIEPKGELIDVNYFGNDGEIIYANTLGMIAPSLSEQVKELQSEIFNIKFNYERLVNFTRDLLTHEQHVQFAAKKKELFG